MWIYNGVLTSEDIEESCLKIIHETQKMEGLNLSKEVSTKKQYFGKILRKQILILEKDIQKCLKIKNSSNRFWNKKINFK